MPDSPLLQMPYLAASQAQKHVTHNEALSLLDGLIHLAVVSRVIATPPASPTDGQRYLIPVSPLGEWVGKAGKIALRMEGAWRYLTPLEGWRLWISDEDVLLTFNGSVWVSPGVPSSLQNLSLLGVNATADTTNKLTVAAAATLFNHVGNGHQIKLNKNVAGDTASILFQTGFSGRAEIGTTGDDSFHFKVSANGSSYNEAIVIDAASGRVNLPNTAVLQPQATDPASPVDGQLWYNSTTAKFRTREAGLLRDLFQPAGIEIGLLAASHLIMN